MFYKYVELFQYLSEKLSSQSSVLYSAIDNHCTLKKGLNNEYDWKDYGCFPISQVSDCKTDNNTVFQLLV